MIQYNPATRLAKLNEFGQLRIRDDIWRKHATLGECLDSTRKVGYVKFNFMSDGTTSIWINRWDHTGAIHAIFYPDSVDNGNS